MSLQKQTKTTTKLTGYEFYQSIGSPKRVLAPMVQMSELPFRLYMRKKGIDLCYTPMMISKHFHSLKFRKNNIQFHEKDRPLFVQFAGNDPDVLLQSALFVQDKCDAIDVNMGCPQPSVAGKGHYGSYLLDTEEDRQLCVEIVKKLDQNLSIPVTCKIRLIPDSEDKMVGDVEKTITFAKQLEKAGCAILAVHGRTRFNKGRKMTKTNWGAIARVKESVSIPVIANGSIETLQDYKECLKESKADAVMVAMGCLNNPWLFLNIGNRGDLNWEHQRRKCANELVEFILQKQDKKQFKIVSEHIIRSHLYYIIGKQFYSANQLREKMTSTEEMIKVLNKLEELQITVIDPKDSNSEKKKGESNDPYEEIVSLFNN